MISVLVELVSGIVTRSSLTRRAVFVTALPLESAAVCSYLSSTCERQSEEGSTYQCGRFRSGRRSWNVCVVETGRGNVAAALETQRAIMYFRPTVVVFVGVAGGLKDVTIGDVVVATRVYPYESGKHADEVQPRIGTVMPTYAILEVARATARSEKWLQRIKTLSLLGKPKVYLAPIAAGEKVLSSQKSQVYHFIRHNCSDAVAVEMEGYGFLEATWRNESVDALLVRGISDSVEGKEASDSQGLQPQVASIAAAFAFEVLSNWSERKGRVHNA